MRHTPRSIPSCNAPQGSDRYLCESHLEPCKLHGIDHIDEDGVLAAEFQRDNHIGGVIDASLTLHWRGDAQECDRQCGSSLGVHGELQAGGSEG